MLPVDVVNVVMLPTPNKMRPPINDAVLPTTLYHCS